MVVAAKSPLPSKPGAPDDTLLPAAVAPPLPAAAASPLATAMYAAHAVTGAGPRLFRLQQRQPYLQHMTADC